MTKQINIYMKIEELKIKLDYKKLEINKKIVVDK